MNLDDANETDVREEVATPLLSALGYERGMRNDILRELTLSYGRVFLGRKKNNNPPLRGRADYVLSVTGAARWVLEIKAPKEEITKETIEQAISYARHPEVSVTYAAILNGKRFVVMHNSQRSTDEPLVNIDVSSPHELAERVRGLLSPASIKRDCSPPIVDLRRPLVDGFRANANITGGVLIY
jgi:predicted type IV restriction endonuclease